MVSISINAGSDLNGATAALMFCIPTIRIQKPIIISPICFFVGFLQNILNMIPITPITAARTSVDSKSTHPAPPLISERHNTHPVTDVPIIAPIIIPIACFILIIPALTKPTTITEVADDDWIIAVTPVPSSTPLRGVLLNLYRITSSFPPATFFNPSPISCIPKRKSAIPPRRIITMCINSKLTKAPICA